MWFWWTSSSQRPAITSLGDVLFARGFIPLDVKEGIQDTRESARKVVNCLTTQIKHNPSVYQKFVKILREQGQWTELVVEKLTSCYESQTATPESSLVSLKSSESQSKLRLEFTVPQEMFTVLESVQVSVLVEDQVLLLTLYSSKLRSKQYNIVIMPTTNLANL